MAEAPKPDFFRRIDESDDELFYQYPRFVVHIDDGAIAKVGEIYADLLPAGGDDSRSHVQLAIASAGPLSARRRSSASD